MRASVHRAAVLAATVAVAALGGCALNRPPTTDELQRQALPHTNVPAVWKAAGGAPDPVADYWLSTFDDPALSALVNEAQAYNADLQVAAARACGASYVVTRNLKDFRESPIPARTPLEILAELG